MNRSRWILLGLASLLVLAGVLASMTPRTSWSPKPLPNPNGYDELLKNALALSSPPNPQTASRAELQTAMDQNREVLAALRSALRKPSQVPVQKSDAYLTNHMPELQALKRLPWLLDDHGKLAELEGQTNIAAQDYLDIAWLGIRVRNGGLLIDALVGVSIESAGLKALDRIAAGLKPATAEHARTGLQQIASQAEPARIYLDRERAWARAAHPIRYPIVQMLRPGMLDAPYKSFEKKMGNLEADRKALIDSLARNSAVQSQDTPKRRE